MLCLDASAALAAARRARVAAWCPRSPERPATSVALILLSGARRTAAPERNAAREAVVEGVGRPVSRAVPRRPNPSSDKVSNRAALRELHGRSDRAQRRRHVRGRVVSAPRDSMQPSRRAQPAALGSLRTGIARQAIPNDCARVRRPTPARQWPSQCVALRSAIPVGRRAGPAPDRANGRPVNTGLHRAVGLGQEAGPKPRPRFRAGASAQERGLGVRRTPHGPLVGASRRAGGPAIKDRFGAASPTNPPSPNG
jgi:hypothetical protein